MSATPRGWDSITGDSDIPAWDALSEGQRGELAAIGYGPLSYPHYVEEYKEWYGGPTATMNLRDFFSRLRDAHFGGHGSDHIEYDFEDRHALAALRARAEAAEKRLAAIAAALNDGCNLINYSVSGLPVGIGDWLRHIATCRELLGDAYREYDARSK